MDIWESKNVKPMLIGEMQDAFDSPDYIYELKLDGVRCIAYLDDAGTELRNKRNIRISPIYPELAHIHTQVGKRCILDGELVVMNQGKPDFAEIQRRALTNNRLKIELAAVKLPVSFIAFDILYVDGEQITHLTLMERKSILSEIVTTENERLAVSRFIEEQGIALFDFTIKNELEGIVAKRKESKYFFGKETKDWIKFKRLEEDDFTVCGYIENVKNHLSLVLGQYDAGRLVYKGHVTLSGSGRDLQIIKAQLISSCPFSNGIPKGNESAVWLSPELVCIVQWMPRKNDALNQAVFKGLRDDKEAIECVVKREASNTQ